jgi:hypothetical protein
MQYSGMIISFIIISLGFVFGWWPGLTDIQVGIVLYILIAPTLITSFFVENRLLKDTARFLLGFSFSLAFVQLIFTPEWLVKGWILLNFIPGYIYLNRKRAEKNKQICDNCVEKDKEPNCSGYQIYNEREQIFLNQALYGGVRDPLSLSPDQLDD